MTRREEIREQIIEAAADRFARFGYGKTSMAEIARDCRMSTGNIYRYFTNKLDVAECIVRSVFRRTLAALKSALAGRDISAAEKVRLFVITEMEYTYSLLDKYPTLLDQAKEVRAKRPLCVEEYRRDARAILADILREGADAGEFHVEDCTRTAKNIHAATLKFRYPQLHTELTLDKLTREANGVVSLLLHGIRARA